MVNRLNAWVADASVVSAQAFSAIPGGHFHVGVASGPMLLVYDLEHGAGAACFSAGASGAVLLDCGDPKSFKFVVKPSLRKLGIEPDSVVLSHPDGGHLGGGAAVWQAFPIRQALMPVSEARSSVYRSWIDDGAKAGIRQHRVAASEWHAFPDGASLEVLYAPDPRTANGIADERVAIFRLHWRGWKLLLTSDAGMGTEQKLLDRGKDVAADVILAGRHRSDLTLCDAFLDAVHPQAIIASNASIPAEERLDSNTVDYWKSRGIQVVDQAESGGVTVRVDEVGNLRIDGFLSASPLVLKPR
jgi:competence protein ComEC